MQVKNHEIITDELSSIKNLSRGELLERWELVHQHPPPKGISRRLLEYSISFHIQAKVLGGLNTRSKSRLLSSGKGKKSMQKTKAQTLQPGARLVREWHGKTYTVDVTEHGFTYDGQNYATLSKVANTITGARWSGPRFFGL